MAKRFKNPNWGSNVPIIGEREQEQDEQARHEVLDHHIGFMQHQMDGMNNVLKSSLRIMDAEQTQDEPNPILLALHHLVQITAMGNISAARNTFALMHVLGAPGVPFVKPQPLESSEGENIQ